MIKRINRKNPPVFYCQKLRWAFNKDKTVAETFQNVNDPLLYGMWQKEKKTPKDSEKGVGPFFQPDKEKD